jgi:two-component system, chemotaxis family, protein-glutamate methylesterase/glutaminase
MMKLKALVVDDSSLFRRVLTDALSQMAEVEVVGSAPNGKLGLEKAVLLKPDFITLDIEMPEMSGLEVLEAIKQRGLDCGVVVVSALTLKGGQLTIKALEKGAFDFITKPSGSDVQSNMASIRDALTPVVRAYHRRWEIRSILKSPSGAATPAKTSSLPQSEVTVVERRYDPKADMVLLGISTGGPNALTRILPSFPARFPAPVFIVQHMPPLFTQSLAESLAGKCAVRVKEAEDGEVARPGTVYIAPGGRQMKLAPGVGGEVVIRITDDPPENNCRPSVDTLFRSAANHFPGRSCAVIMTGMGSDGVLGLRLLRRHDCRVIAQDEATCVVYGMPGEAVKAGVVDTVVPLDRIVPEILKSVKGATL